MKLSVFIAFFIVIFVMGGTSSFAADVEEVTMGVTGTDLLLSADTNKILFPYKDSAGTVVRLANEDSQPFRFSGKPLKGQVPYTGLNKKYEKSFAKFFSVQDCLIKTERQKAMPDLTQIDWSLIDNAEDASICLFRIAASYGSPEDMKAWFEAGGFKNVEIVKSDISWMAKKIVAKWDVRKHGLRFWSNPLSMAYRRLITRGVYFYSEYDNSNHLTGVAVDENFVFTE